LNTARFRILWNRFIGDKLVVLGAVLVFLFLVIAVFGPQLAPYDFAQQFRAAAGELLPMDVMSTTATGERLLLGSDSLGRDMLSRLIYGTRTTLVISISSVLMATILAIILGSLTGYYEHRGTILWTGDNVVVVTHQAGNQSPRWGALFARISLDGGKTWADGSPSGTPRMNQSTRFELVPKPPGHSFTAPTLELSRNRFLTPYLHGSIAAGTATVTGVFWRLERR